MARSMAIHNVRDQGKKAKGTTTAATPAPIEIASIGGSGQPMPTPRIKMSTTTVWARQMLRNHEPSHWPGTRSNTRPQVGQAGSIITHARNRPPCPQTGQRRAAPLRKSVDVVTGTHPLCALRPNRSIPGAVASASVSDPSGTDVATSAAAVPAAPAGGSVATRADTSALAARFETLAADDFAGYCPIYERVARAIAEDDASLALLLDAAPVGRTPVLFLAAVHDLVLGDPDSTLAHIYAGRSAADPWPPFRELLHRRTPEILGLMRTRSIQTNEVGRSAALVPALAAVQRRARSAGDERPLALVELGPSAGLNLLLDRYRVTYRRAGQVRATAGDPASPVQLDCEVRGPADPPLDGLPLVIASRTGLDLSPVDVTDDEACRWLAACVWPGVPDRPGRLAAAIALARLDPPPLVTGDAVTDLAPLVAALPDDVLPVVISTWALAYLGRDGRATMLAALDDVGTTRDLALVTAEQPHSTPWIPALPPEVAAVGDADGDGTTTVLGAHTWRDGMVDDEVLALTHPHVRWIAWVPGAGETT